MKEIVISALLGSCGALGLCFFLTCRWLENRLEQAESLARERRAQARERYRLNALYMYCVGRLQFWIVHGLKRFDPAHNFFNGEMQKAFEDLQKCENEIKELDRKQLANINEE